MINLKQKLFFSIVTLSTVILCSCGTVRLTETQSIGKNSIIDGVSENEDLKISYDFWGEHGLMYFSIYNKSTKPIYIDWKKSVFVHNHWKNDYWMEKTSSESFTIPIGDEKSRSFKNVMSTVTAERVTFIPPDCYVSVPMTYEILDHLNRKQKLNTYKEKKIIKVSDNLRWEEKAKKEKIHKPNGKSVKAIVLNYTKEESPYRFRNFLTYSSDELFKTEKHIDDEFYVSRFIQMGGYKFFGTPFKFARAPRDPKMKKNGKMRKQRPIQVYQSPFRKSTSFYKTL